MPCYYKHGFVMDFFLVFCLRLVLWLFGIIKDDIDAVHHLVFNLVAILFIYLFVSDGRMFFDAFIQLEILVECKY